MKRYVHSLIGCLGIALPSAAIAACGAGSCENVIVKTIYVQSNGNVLVEVDADSSSLNCTRVSDVFMTLQTSDANADMIYSMLLSTQAAGRPIARLRIVEQSADCRISYAVQSS